MKYGKTKLRYPFRVGRPTSLGNGQLDPRTVTLCRDMGHAWSCIRAMATDRPHEDYVIRPAGGTVFTNRDIDALMRCALLTSIEKPAVEAA